MPEFVLHRGDCHQFLPTITQPIQAIASDPPFGCRNDCDYTRFSGGLTPKRNHHFGIIGDDKPFDPNPFLNFLGCEIEPQYFAITQERNTAAGKRF